MAVDKNLKKEMAKLALTNMFHDTPPLAFSRLGQLNGFDDEEAKEFLIDRMIEFGSKRELETGEDNSSYSMSFTNFGFPFGIVRTKNIKKSNIDELIAFTTVKWDNDYRLLRIGTLFGEIKKIDEKNIAANVSSIMIFPEIEEYSVALISDIPEHEKKKVEKKAEHSKQYFPTSGFVNMGVGQALMNKYKKFAESQGSSVMVLAATSDKEALLDRNGQVVYNENGKPKIVDKNSDIFYEEKLGFLKTKYLGQHDNSKMMYKPLKKVDPEKLSSIASNIGTIFTSFGYTIGEEPVESESIILEREPVSHTYRPRTNNNRPR